MQDQDALAAVAEGDTDAFGILVSRHSRAIFAIISRRIPSMDVEDVAQQVFLSAFRSLRDYQGKQPLVHWLARIARRRTCDYWREYERRARHEAPDTTGADGRNHQVEAAEIRNAKAVYVEDQARRDAVSRIEEALGKLSVEERMLMEYIYFEDLPLREVAHAFGWTLVKVKVKAHRTRKRLHTLLDAIARKEQVSE